MGVSKAHLYFVSSKQEWRSEFRTEERSSSPDSMDIAPREQLRCRFVAAGFEIDLYGKNKSQCPTVYGWTGEGKIIILKKPIRYC